MDATDCCYRLISITSLTEGTFPFRILVSYWYRKS